jgi:PAS domain S-box-containing protein/putative nucleotidyltransferase with HDIG domain
MDAEHALDLAEEAAGLSASHFERFVEQAPVAICVTRDGIGLYANQRFAELIGLDDADSLIGTEVYRLFALQVQEESRERIRRRALELAVPSEFDSLFQRGDGSEFPVHLAVGPVHLQDGRADIAFLTDITDRRRAEDALRISKVQLQLTLKGAVSALSTTTELRDPYTAGHQRRVAQLSCAIAAELGFGEARLELLRTAALLHDIGKILVPAEILSKPGKLSDVEMQLIRQHPGAGADIVGPIGFAPDVAEILRQHHERLDGSGYPAGLRGAQILAEARILAVADVVEAMISHRPYRAALSIEAAVAELGAGANVRYELAACEAAITLIREQGFAFDG